MTPRFAAYKGYATNPHGCGPSIVLQADDPLHADMPPLTSAATMVEALGFAAQILAVVADTTDNPTAAGGIRLAIQYAKAASDRLGCDCPDPPPSHDVDESRRLGRQADAAMNRAVGHLRDTAQALREERH